jgi:hypothetical protein
MKWKEKLNSFGAVKCCKKEQREQKRIPASNFTLGYPFSRKLCLNDQQYSIHEKLPYFFSVLRPTDLAEDYKVFFRFYRKIMA